MKGDVDYRGWVIYYSDLFDQYLALHDRSRRTYYAKTIKEIKAKIKRHVERWGW